MDRELLAYLIMAVLVLAFFAIVIYARHNTRDRKAARQREREREVRASRKSDLI